jgi:HD-like signal output (HDOD) protein
VPRKVSSVREAVALLGLQAVREAVLLTEVFAEPDTLGLMNEVQRRALFRARMARLIAEGSPMTALASEAALLADLGVYVLALRLPVTYRGIWERHRSQKVPLREVELEVLGVSHDRLGAALLGMWNLPATVVTAVGCAHELPSGDAIIDTRSVLALSNLMVDEVLGLSVVAEDPAVDRLSAQLGLSARLPMLRDWAAKTWTSLVSKEDL